MTRYPAQSPAKYSLKNTWYIMVGCLVLYIVIGNLIGPLGDSYFISGFYLVFFLFSSLIIFYLIPAVRKFIYKKAGQNAERPAALATWGLAQCIALFGLSAYLMAGDKGTFYGLLIGSFIVHFNFRPKDILS